MPSTDNQRSAITVDGVIELTIGTEATKNPDMAFYFLFRTALAGLLLSLCAVAKLRPPTVLKTSGVIQVVEDFEMHESRHVITFFVYFDQPIYYIIGMKLVH